jgi:hypothetical protein
LLHGALDGGRDQVVGDGGGDLLGDKGVGVGLGHVDAFADLAAHELFVQLDEHGGGLGVWGWSLSPALGPRAAWGPPCGRGA